MAEGVININGVRISDRTGMKRLPLGDDGFARAAGRSLLIDKTMLIADLLDRGNAVTLFCRPRRFGKTLNMSMLRSFFELSQAEDLACPDARNLFEGLEIWDAAGGRYRAHQGAYPVVFISFNTVKKATWEESRAAIEGLIAREFINHRYLLESDELGPDEKRYVQRMCAGGGSGDDLASSLSNLASMLYAHHHRRVILLIDEYDAPLMASVASEIPYYQEAVNFMKGWLTGALKDAGAAMEFACLTGVQRISKESIFSDLNNLVVSTPLDGAFDDRFGFTDAEVTALCTYLGHEDKIDEMRAWYDGYRFGGASIYNPWSVLSYLDGGCEPGTYWVNTSSNSVIAAAVRTSDAATLDELYHLTQPGATVMARLNLDAVLPDVGVRSDALWGMLYLAGYVTTDDTARPRMRSMERALRLPNTEVMTLFRDEIVERMSQGAGGENGLKRLHKGFVEGDATLVERELCRILLMAPSFFDLVDENSYHMLLLGLCFGLNGYANPVSNREAGAGRFDIQIVPVTPDNPMAALTLRLPRDAPLITIEVKYAADADEAQLRNLAHRALNQIVERGYDAGDLPGAATHRVRFGVACAGKTAAVVGGRV